MVKQLNALSGNTASHMDDLGQRISELEKRTTSYNELGNPIEFKFGYERGTYGYYLTDGTFKPF